MESPELTEDPSSVVNTNIFCSCSCLCVYLVPRVFGGLGSIFLPSFVWVKFNALYLLQHVLQQFLNRVVLFIL